MNEWMKRTLKATIIFISSLSFNRIQMVVVDVYCLGMVMASGWPSRASPKSLIFNLSNLSMGPIGHKLSEFFSNGAGFGHV